MAKESQIDIYADDMEPELKLTHRIYVKSPPCKDGDTEVSLLVAMMVYVDKTGEITNINQFNMSRYSYGDMVKYLQEWELAVMRPIGPEDSELFATKKLDPEWGIE